MALHRKEDQMNTHLEDELRDENLVHRFVFDVDFPGEMGVGLWPYQDTVTVLVEEGIFKDEVPSFVDSYMLPTLREWFDGAGVVYRKEG